MSGRRACAGALLALVLVVAACSSSDGGDTAGGTAPAAGDDGAIRLSAILPDLGPLVEIGLAPDVGDLEQNYQVFVDEINDAGGVAGRELDIGFQFFDASATATEQQPACVGATQDDDAFAVILAAASSTRPCCASPSRTSASRSSPPAPSPPMCSSGPRAGCSPTASRRPV